MAVVTEDDMPRMTCAINLADKKNYNIFDLTDQDLEELEGKLMVFFDDPSTGRPILDPLTNEQSFQYLNFLVPRLPVW